MKSEAGNFIEISIATGEKMLKMHTTIVSGTTRDLTPAGARLTTSLSNFRCDSPTKVTERPVCPEKKNGGEMGEKKTSKHESIELQTMKYEEIKKK